MISDPPRITEIELQPVHSKGDLVVDNWWLPGEAPKPEPLHRRYRLEFFTLVLPIALGLVYQVLIASPRYISESEFMVRTLGSSDMGNLATLLTDSKVTRASDETYAATEYLTSRDAVDSLVAHDNLRAILSRPQADFINRFPNFFTRDTREQLFRHFEDFITLEVNSESGIAELRVVAFTPQDAIALNKAMLRTGEEFVNQLNNRVFHDSLALAEREVTEQKTKFTAIEDRLTEFRNTQNVLDPTKEVAEAMKRIGELMARLGKAESELEQSTTLAPRGPQLVGLASQVGALRDQIASERAKLIGDKGSLAGKFAEFDHIMLDRLLASKQLEAALAQYNHAHEDLDRQQFYLQTVVQPDTPDQPSRPRRLLNVVLIAGVSFAVYLISRALIKNIREHVA